MSATDREWFAAHPGASEYWRPLMPGDLGLASLACVFGTVDGRAPRVRVRAMSDGIRVRRLPRDLVVRVVTPEGDIDIDGAHVVSFMGTDPDGGYLEGLDIDPTPGGDE